MCTFFTLPCLKPTPAAAPAQFGPTAGCIRKNPIGSTFTFDTLGRAVSALLLKPAPLAAAKPFVLLVGQYSVGKTSFINHLLGAATPRQPASAAHRPARPPWHPASGPRRRKRRRACGAGVTQMRDPEERQQVHAPPRPRIAGPGTARQGREARPPARC